MLDTILGQVFAKVYSTLQQPVQGTDDELRQSELKRAYFNLILSITGAGYSRVFVSPRALSAPLSLYISGLLTSHIYFAQKTSPSSRLFS